MNTTEQTVETPQQESVAAVETHGRASLPAEEVVPVMETHDRASLQTNESNAPAKRSVAENPDVASPKTETVTPRTNVRQEVLPPNSTLAKQLAADPVLRTLSDENVEWTPPTHLSIPNLFTPNGDGVNDMFVIEGLEGYIVAEHDNVLLICKKEDSSALVRKYANEVGIKCGPEYV